MQISVPDAPIQLFPQRKIRMLNIHLTYVFLSESQNSRNTKRHFAFDEKTFVHL